MIIKELRLLWINESVWWSTWFIPNNVDYRLWYARLNYLTIKQSLRKLLRNLSIENSKTTFLRFISLLKLNLVAHKLEKKAIETQKTFAGNWCPMILSGRNLIAEATRNWMSKIADKQIKDTVNKTRTIQATRTYVCFCWRRNNSFFELSNKQVI